MLLFPDSFLDPAGEFLAVIPGDMVPVLYVTADARLCCAACLNAVQGFLDPLTTEERSWCVVDYELLYEGSPVACDHCHAQVGTLYGDADGPACDGTF